MPGHPWFLNRNTPNVFTGKWLFSPTWLILVHLGAAYILFVLKIQVLSLPAWHTGACQARIGSTSSCQWQARLTKLMSCTCCTPTCPWCRSTPCTSLGWSCPRLPRTRPSYRPTTSTSLRLSNITTASGGICWWWHCSNGGNRSSTGGGAWRLDSVQYCLQGIIHVVVISESLPSSLIARFHSQSQTKTNSGNYHLF